jgi:hypothetical protein
VPEPPLVAPSGTYDDVPGGDIEIILTFPQAMNVAVIPIWTDLLYSDATPEVDVEADDRWWNDATHFVIRYTLGHLAAPPCTFRFPGLLSNFQTATGQNYPAFGPIALAPA